MLSLDIMGCDPFEPHVTYLGATNADVPKPSLAATGGVAACSGENLVARHACWPRFPLSLQVFLDDNSMNFLRISSI